MMAAKIILGISIFWTILSSMIILHCVKDNDYDEATAWWVAMWLFSCMALIGSSICVWAG